MHAPPEAEYVPAEHDVHWPFVRVRPGLHVTVLQEVEPVADVCPVGQFVQLVAPVLDEYVFAGQGVH